jgi:hypothetical protein
MDQNMQKLDEVSGEVKEESGKSGRRIDRRTLLRAGAAATPVLLTLSSGPVSAGTNGCVVASSFISATTFKSRNAGATKILNCASKTCEQWQSQCGSSGQAWSTYTATTTVGSALGVTSSTYNGSTLNQVLQQALNTTSELGVTQHLVAMLLNVKYNGSSFPGVANSTTYLQGVWGNYKQNSNKYIIGGALSWDSAAVVTWLRDLMGQSL